MTAPCWDLSIVYQSLNDLRIEQDITLINQCIDLLAFQANDYQRVEVVQNAILTYEAAGRLIGTINNFANCYVSVDAKNNDAKLLSGKMTKIIARMQQAFNPFELTLTYADDDFIQQVLDHENTDISGRAFYIRNLRKVADTRLSIAEENLITALAVDGKKPWNTLYDNLTGSLQVTLEYADGQSETLGFSQAASLLYGNEFERQQAAWKGIQRAMATHQESFAAIVNALAGWRLTEIEKRSTKREVHFLEPSLHMSRIQPQTLETMMQCAKHSRHIAQKAGRLMASVHGETSMFPWNHMASMPSLNKESNPEISTLTTLNSDKQTYSFAEAIQVIREAFTTVSPEMSEFVQTMVDNGWIDAAAGSNKRLGAYCTKLPATRTPLVFMTWGGSRSDLMTLAHELGHAFHHWVMHDIPLCQTDYPMTLAETASIFAENIVRDYLISTAETVDDKLAMLWEELSSATALLINIPVRFEFETAFYQQRQTGELTAEQLCQLMSTTWQEWYGDMMPEPDPYFWASKLHFSLSGVNFYNYPYLFGYLFSLGIYAQREAKGDNFYNDYISLLCDTGSMTAEELVEKHLNIDLKQADFWQQSLLQVSNKVDEFERLWQSRSAGEAGLASEDL